MAVNKSTYKALAIKNIGDVYRERIVNRRTTYAHQDRMEAMANRFVGSAEAIGNLYSRPNPTETPAAHIKRVATSAAKFEAQGKAGFDELNSIIVTSMNRTQAAIDRKLNLNEDKFAPEIRAAYRSMSNEDRHQLLKRLADECKGPEIAAIVRAPAILSGISEAEQKLYVDRMIRTHCPAELAEQEAVNEDAKAILSILRVVDEVANEFKSPQLMADIEKLERDATAAQAMFDVSADAA